MMSLAHTLHRAPSTHGLHLHTARSGIQGCRQESRTLPRVYP
ncbi:hypothetical protein PCLA_03r0295 [Pseudomonas citronellolis]|nr:hypothetical protein PCLA_03r0295 [Pseudomonas citronellolis]